MAFENEDITIKTAPTDEFGAALTDGIVTYYDENNNILGTSPVMDVMANITISGYGRLQTTTITVQYNDTTNKYCNNTNATAITISDAIYVGPNATTPHAGTKDNPTTLADAISRIKDNLTIVMLNGAYDINSTVNINENTTKAKNFTITGENTVIITGNDSAGLFNINKGYTVIFNNLTLTNGISRNGGLIYSEGNLTITNSTFKNGYAINGGAIYHYYGSLAINNCIFINNTGTSNGGAIVTYGTSTISNTIFTNNIARYGGAILIFRSDITNCTFANNKAYCGGSIRSCSDLTVTDSKFINNTVDNYGSGLAIYADTNSTIKNTTFINNTAKAGSQGTIYNYRGNLTVANCTFCNNSVNQGGAIYHINENSDVESGNLIVADNIFINNTAYSYSDEYSGDGGAIYASKAGNATIKNNEFVNIAGETLCLPSITGNKIISGNTYNNCTIELNLTINLNEQTQYPIKVNDTVNLTIGLTPLHLDYYDEDINLDDLFNVSYDVYMNNAIQKQTGTNAKAYAITPDAYGDVTTYVTLKDDPAVVSNTITLDVEIYNLQNTVIDAPDILIYYQEYAIVTVTVTNKTGAAVLDGGIVEAYDENNQLI